MKQNPKPPLLRCGLYLFFFVGPTDETERQKIRRPPDWRRFTFVGDHKLLDVGEQATFVVPHFLQHSSARGTGPSRCQIYLTAQLTDGEAEVFVIRQQGANFEKSGNDLRRSVAVFPLFPQSLGISSSVCKLKGLVPRADQLWLSTWRLKRKVCSSSRMSVIDQSKKFGRPIVLWSTTIL